MGVCTNAIFLEKSIAMELKRNVQRTFGFTIVIKARRSNVYTSTEFAQEDISLNARDNFAIFGHGRRFCADYGHFGEESNLR